MITGYLSRKTSYRQSIKLISCCTSVYMIQINESLGGPIQFKCNGINYGLLQILSIAWKFYCTKYREIVL